MKHPVVKADLWLLLHYKMWRWRQEVKAWSKRVIERPEVLRSLEALPLRPPHEPRRPHRGNRTV